MQDSIPSDTRAVERDPVCGMTVDPAVSPHQADHLGVRYHFCSARCVARFTASPQTYLAPRPAAPAAAGAQFTCPMHPDVLQAGPGACPICGMALEPLLISADAPSDTERVHMTRRFWIALGLTLPVFVLEMGAHLFGPGFLVSMALSVWIQFALTTPVVLWAGWPFLVRGWASVRSGHLNMFTLIALGVAVAYGDSVLALLAPDAFPALVRDRMGSVPVYFEAAAVITTLVLLGQVLELGARARTGGAIRALIDLAPRTARRVRPTGGDEDVPLDQVTVGDLLRVRPGDKIPVDGVVAEGRVSIDESLVTGESMPVAKAPGDKVVAGSLNRTGSFILRAEKVGDDTLLSQIIRMVAAAQRSRAPIQGLADRVAGWFVPGVIFVALLTAAVWMLAGPADRVAMALVSAVSVLIIACPCALGLATPMSIMVGVGRGARAGILIRNAEALERLEKIDTLIIDKTGTLTEGRPAVTAIHPEAGFDELTLLRLAASLEQGSEHPLAEAILQLARSRGIALSHATGFDSPLGRGVTGIVEGRRIIIGNARFVQTHGVETGALAAEADRLSADGATVVHVGADGVYAGLLAISDPVRPTARAAIAALQAQGLQVVMMTGDHPLTAHAVARQLGIAEVEAEVLPQDKARVVQRLRSEGRSVAMAGDGVNDAPALAAAEVGVAMGAGSDVAIQSAGVTLLNGDLMGLVRARRLSRGVMRNIRQNLIFAFVYNLAGVPIAAGVLYPAFHILLSPQIGAAAMALSSVSVIGNALRLGAIRLDDQSAQRRRA